MFHRILAYRTREPVAESYLVALNLHIGMRLGIGMNHAQIPGLIVSRWRGFDAFRHDEKMRASGSSCIALVVVVRRQAAGRDSCSHTRTTRPATVRQPCRKNPIRLIIAVDPLTTGLALISADHPPADE